MIYQIQANNRVYESSLLLNCPLGKPYFPMSISSHYIALHHVQNKYSYHPDPTQTNSVVLCKRSAPPILISHYPKNPFTLSLSLYFFACSLLLPYIYCSQFFLGNLLHFILTNKRYSDVIDGLHSKNHILLHILDQFHPFFTKCDLTLSLPPCFFSALLSSIYNIIVFIP